MTHDNLPEELRPDPDAPSLRPRRSLPVRVLVIVVTIAIIVTMVGVWVVQAGLIFPM